MAADDDAPGAGGLGDLFAQFEHAQELIQSAAAEASATIVEGSAADGRVVIQLSGDLDAVAVHIDPALVDPGDVGMLEDLVLAAIRDGLAQIGEVQEGMAGAFTGASGGLDLSALLGSLGNIPGLGDLSSLGNLGSLDLGAMAQLPGLEGLGELAGGTGGLAGGTGQAGGSTDDDDDHEDPPGEDPSRSSGSDDAGTPGPG